MAQLREAVRVPPYYVPARAELVQLLAVAGHPGEALQALQTAVKLRPDDALARFRLGSVLGSLGRVNEAEEEFEQATRLQPDNADTHYNSGTRGRATRKNAGGGTRVRGDPMIEA